LLPMLRGRAGEPWRTTFAIEYHAAPGDAIPSWSGLRTDRYKYIEWGDGSTELYDLTADPSELQNLAPDSSDLVSRFAPLLHNLQLCSGAGCFDTAP
jgi:arylsulfatase A-like enzyme